MLRPEPAASALTATTIPAPAGLNSRLFSSTTTRLSGLARSTPAAEANPAGPPPMMARSYEGVFGMVALLLRSVASVGGSSRSVASFSNWRALVLRGVASVGSFGRWFGGSFGRSFGGSVGGSFCRRCLGLVLTGAPLYSEHNGRAEPQIRWGGQNLPHWKFPKSFPA